MNPLHQQLTQLKLSGVKAALQQQIQPVWSLQQRQQHCRQDIGT